MKPSDVDPSLRPAEPPRESLADGFSPPASGQQDPAGEVAAPQPAEAVLGTKSPF